MISTSGISTGLAAATDSFRPTLVPRSTGHQALLFGVSAAVGFGAGAVLTGALRAVGLQRRPAGVPIARAALVVGAAAAAIPTISRRTQEQATAHADWGAPAMNPVKAVAQGTAIGGAIIGGAIGVKTGVAGMSGVLATRFGGERALWTAGTISAGLAAGRGTAPIAMREVLTRLSAAGRAADHAFVEPPENPMVSGGPGSAVRYETLAREGSRFVHLATTAEHISGVTGRPAKDPIRVFVGVDSASSITERVELAIAELERLGAFERSAILAISPAGTGYANPVPAETLEYFTDGDCASVVVQYGLLPSMFSGPAVPEAAATYRMLTDRLIGRGPRVLGYGESLGAQAAQVAWTSEPSMLGEDGAFVGVDAALMVGTPSGTGVKSRVLGKPAVFLADQWQDLPTPLPTGVRLWLLDHDADPVTRFDTTVIYRRPEWLAQRPRGRGIPDQMAWRPLLTWVQLGFDVARATQPQLGKFMSAGHDYRADLAPMVRAAFAPDAPDELLGPVHDALIASEHRRAELLGET